MKWVIEFRNGSFLAADHETSFAQAQLFESKAAAEAFMDAHPWIYFNGGMALAVRLAEQT